MKAHFENLLVADSIINSISSPTTFSKPLKHKQMWYNKPLSTTPRIGFGFINDGNRLIKKFIKHKPILSFKFVVFHSHLIELLVSLLIVLALCVTSRFILNVWVRPLDLRYFEINPELFKVCCKNVWERMWCSLSM